MLGPYRAEVDGKISYVGNKIFQPLSDIRDATYAIDEVSHRIHDLKNNSLWFHISNINHQINLTSNTFFHNLGAKFTALPLITRMISSPGALYGKEKIDYTTDTSPVSLKWFDLQKPVFLAESSQIYLELALNKFTDQVYSIYNSFRKEESDATHLSEFHHIEYEGQVSQAKNQQIAMELTANIIKDLVYNNEKDLRAFLTQEKIDSLLKMSNRLNNYAVKVITFRNALDILHKHTDKSKYEEFTLANFGSWEEIKLTEILNDMVIIKEFPLYEVPFYHSKIENSDPLVANNSDFIWPGYREFIGSGSRVRHIDELTEKARDFNLPKEDYSPYLQSRNLPDYQPTSGFGMGWERLLQGMLEMPFIWSAVQFPRVHNNMKI